MSVVQTIAAEQSLLKKIRTRGYWRVVIRPREFEKTRVPSHDDLFMIIANRSVQLRGWDFPHVDISNKAVRRFGEDWLEQESEWDRFLEFWRFHMSGLLLDFFPIENEWVDRSKILQPDQDWEPGKYLYYLPTIYSILEIFEFAVRLSMSPAGAPLMRLEIDIKGLEGRRLHDRENPKIFSKNYIAGAPDWNYVWEGSQIDLIARPRELAAIATQKLFEQFGLNLGLQTLSMLQETIGR
ncbi:MAG: hypothetical protein NVSMB14_08910 [Isosphaeraceae bacterium]